MTPEQASRSRPKITFIVGNEYVHKERPVVIADHDSGGVWLAPIGDEGRAYHLPFHKLGQLKPPEPTP